MTTIAWDGKSVAADGRGVSGYYLTPGDVEKIKVVDGVVYAICGLQGVFDAFIKWHQDGADPDKCPCAGKEAAQLIVFNNGVAVSYRTESPYPSTWVSATSWGTGSEFAIGAMKAGADARRAVEIAAECDVNTGGRVICFELGE